MDWRSSVIGEYEGIRIADCSYRKDLEPAFLRAITRALELVAKKDPRRFLCIRRHLGFIVHHELDGAWAKYDRWPSGCEVDFDKYKFDESPETAVFLLAVSLVHEATHGRLSLHRGVSGGLPAQVRMRMERMCHLEEMRFARRVDSRFGEVYQRTVFRSERWRSWYEERDRRTEWQVLTGIARRFLESHRASNQALHRMAAQRRRSAIRESVGGRHR